MDYTKNRLMLFLRFPIRNCFTMEDILNTMLFFKIHPSDDFHHLNS